MAAAQECGIPFNADYNGATQDGVSYMQYSIANGVRHSTAGGVPAADRRRSEPAGRAPRPREAALFEGTRCVGVELCATAGVERERAPR